MKDSHTYLWTPSTRGQKMKHTRKWTTLVCQSPHFRDSLPTRTNTLVLNKETKRLLWALQP